MRKDAAPLPVEITSSRLPNGKIVLIARDISQRKQAEAELRQSREQLRNLSIYLKTTSKMNGPQLRTRSTKNWGRC